MTHDRRQNCMGCPHSLWDPNAGELICVHPHTGKTAPDGMYPVVDEDIDCPQEAV